MNCTHEKLKIKEGLMSDGRPYLKQVCIACHIRIGGALPMLADVDVPIFSHKHPHSNLGEIIKVDRDYIRWVITIGKAPERVKKAAARLFMGVPYVPRKNNEVIPFHESYDSTISAGFVRDIKNNKA